MSVRGLDPIDENRKTGGLPVFQLDVRFRMARLQHCA